VPLEPQELYGALFDIHKSLAGVAVPRPLAQLASIEPFTLYVTSTFDDLLCRALERARPRSGKRTDVIVYRGNGGDAEDLPGRIDQLPLPTVFHLFGTISPNDNDFVVTEEDALEFFNSLQSAKRPTRLFDELNRKDLLVVGCRFPAWLVRSFIRMARGERLRLARGRTVFVVDTGAREDRALLDFLRVFRTRTEVVEHSGPVEFVDELHRRWTAIHPEVGSPNAPVERATEGRSPDDAVFLSYASEDRPTVESIARLLEAKLDTWFDRDQLIGGDRFEDRIRDNIERCRLFVPVLSRRWELQEERFFWREWRQALHRTEGMPPGRLFIAPIVIDDLPYSSGLIPRELRTLNWLQFRPGKEAELCDKLQQAYKASQTGSQ